MYMALSALPELKNSSYVNKVNLRQRSYKGNKIKIKIFHLSPDHGPSQNQS